MGNIVRTLLQGVRQIRHALDERFAAVDASFATFIVLDTIALEPGLNQRAIGRHLSIEGPSITRHLDHLEAAGLVTRRRDPEDRRTIRVWLTAAGEAHYQTLCPIITDVEDAALRQVSAADCATAQRVIVALLTTLGKEASAKDD